MFISVIRFKDINIGFYLFILYNVPKSEKFTGLIFVLIYEQLVRVNVLYILIVGDILQGDEKFDKLLVSCLYWKRFFYKYNITFRGLIGIRGLAVEVH